MSGYYFFNLMFKCINKIQYKNNVVTILQIILNMLHAAAVHNKWWLKKVPIFHNFFWFVINTGASSVNATCIFPGLDTVVSTENCKMCRVRTNLTIR